MAHLKIGTFGESQGELAQNTNYLEDGVEGVDRARAARARARAPAADARIKINLFIPTRTHAKPPQNKSIYPDPKGVRVWHLTVLDSQGQPQTGWYA